MSPGLPTPSSRTSSPFHRPLPDEETTNTRQAKAEQALDEVEKLLTRASTPGSARGRSPNAEQGQTTAKRVEDIITPTRGNGQKAVEHSQQHVIPAKSRERTASGSIALPSEPALEQQAAADPTTPRIETDAQQPVNDFDPSEPTLEQKAAADSTTPHVKSQAQQPVNNVSLPVNYKALEVVKSIQDHVTHTTKAQEREAGFKNEKTLHHDVGDYTSNDGRDPKVEKLDNASAGLGSKIGKLKPAGASRTTRFEEPDIMSAGGKLEVEKLHAARVESHHKSTAWYAALLECLMLNVGLIHD